MCEVMDYSGVTGGQTGEWGGGGDLSACHWLYISLKSEQWGVGGVVRLFCLSLFMSVARHQRTGKASFFVCLSVCLLCTAIV